MYKIFIDPGHGGQEPGAVNSTIQEKTLNLEVSLWLKKLLQQCGFELMMSREADIEVSLSKRCDMANLWGANLFISIHHNAGGGDGFEVIHSIAGGKGKELAELVGHQFELTGQNKRNIYSKESEQYKGKDYFAVIRDTNMPSVITEYAFMDTNDFGEIDEAREYDVEATAIAVAVCKFYNVLPRFLEKEHWAEKHYQSLLAKSIVINEKRFDDKISRGEIFALLDRIIK